jgi:hypothetical protein
VDEGRVASLGQRSSLGFGRAGLIRRCIESGSERSIALVRDAPGLSVCDTTQAPLLKAIAGL